MTYTWTDNVLYNTEDGRILGRVQEWPDGFSFRARDEDNSIRYQHYITAEACKAAAVRSLDPVATPSKTPSTWRKLLEYIVN